MTVLPPSWAMVAVGLDGSDDFHLVKGIHLRVVTPPEIGLPIRPFLVYRLAGDVAQRQTQPFLRTEITWVDSQGTVLSLPFEVQPGNPVTGYITRPPGVRAIAVGLVTEGNLTMVAFLDTPPGRRILGRRDEPAYMFAAPDIQGVVLSGKALIRSAFWFAGDVSIVEKLEPLLLLDLPVAAAARYEGLPDAADRAEKRVRQGAPTRLGLHDDPSVAGPAAAAPATDDDEWKRVEPLAKELLPHLMQVLDDLSALPAKLTLPQVLTEGVEPEAFAESQISSLSAVLSATADPGVARWLGFSVVDDDSVALSGSITLYFVRGFLAIDNSELDVAQRFSLAISGGQLSADLSSPQLPFKVPMQTKEGLPVFDFTVPVVVFPGTPPLRPQPPGIGAQLPPAVLVGHRGTVPPATADGQGPWLAESVPPEARREVVLPLSGLTGAPTLAAARIEGMALFPLNDKHPVSNRALALVPAVPENALETGTGEISDREVPPDPVRFRVAQADWFGRWSQFAERLIGAKARARPPAPVADVQYVLAPTTPVDNSARFGTLSVRLQVPRPEDLAPGSRLLVSAQVDAVIGGVSVSATGTLSSPAQTVLEVVVPGPPGMIARAGSVPARIEARWHDGVAFGPPSEPILRTLVDPRPPAALVLLPTLRYSARPDATGRARMVLDWNAAPGVRYRVFTTDETRLRGALQQRAAAGNTTAQSLLADLATAPMPAHRGQAYTQAGRASLYTRDLFTNLTAEPLAPPPGPTRFSYDLSGSLTVLAFFKIVALSAENVESPFTEATLLPVGVPSGGPPPRPNLDFLDFTLAGHARLRVTVVRGPQAAVRWRLRRSTAESADALRMPVVAEGTVPTAGGEGPAVFEIQDGGLDPLAGGALRPWTRMSWRVEVQAGSPPGSTLPGEWSPASNAVSGMRVPPAPAAPTELAIASVVADAVTLNWQHPDPLQKGSQGGYRFDVYRREPGQRESLAGFVLADEALTGSGPPRSFGYTHPGPTPPATSWRVVTLDPAGRLSPPSNTAVQP